MTGSAGDHEALDNLSVDNAERLVVSVARGELEAGDIERGLAEHIRTI